MALTAAQLEQQKQQAEELLFSGPQALGFAKGLFFGHYNGALLNPYPHIALDEQSRVNEKVDEVRQYAEELIDADAIDRNAEIPTEVVSGLGRLGVLGATAPAEYGGLGLSQLANCRIMEVIGGHDAAVGVFVNAHHSIGIRALLLFGSEEQKRRWLPPLVRGDQLAAFALTEQEAGSDASNVQTTATPTPDGKAYVLNGTKRWITNGGIASVLTVIARTPGGTGVSPVGGSKKKEITAFLVTPDMPGFKVLEARMAKTGIRGTATGRLAFENMVVPAENVLGQVGKGLRIALTVLDFGRTTFGACCTGAAKTCVAAAATHAKRRVQFEQPIADFELVKKKIAWMAAHAFAMEATTSECAHFIDGGFEDYMLETAMLKVWSTDALWQIVNDTIQIFGGKAYFTDEPYERMMRDARINMIGEGANDVLRAFIAMVGIKPVADQLLTVKNALEHPLRDFSTLLSFGGQQLRARFTTPDVPVQDSSLREHASELGRRIRDFSFAVQSMLLKHREDILFRQYVQERLADAACELYASSCTLARLDSLLSVGNGHADEVARDVAAGRYFLRLSNRRIKQCLAALSDNDDPETTATADAVLAKF
ncbi:MAG TPA: acyl-CoA dehydrogenase family protein [Gemmataceae bacterium]|nr:acyl-CoA dehydrogenase family protein [Gemmataceae bacterium]